MTKTARVFLVYFMLISIAEMLSTERWAVYALKPLLLISLSVYYYYQTRSARSALTTIFQIALIFACLGDTLLMFQSQHPVFFLLGLGAFLTMQILYTIVFLKSIPKANNANLNFFSDWWILVLIIFISNLIFPKTQGFMTIAVLFYMIAIGLMVIAAWHRRVLANRLSYGLVFCGALLFMASDSFIAFNKFVWPAMGFDNWVMPTYVLGQYLIVEGMCRFKPNTDFEEQIIKN